VEPVDQTLLPMVVSTAVELQVAQPELKAQEGAQVIFELASRYLRELLLLAVAVAAGQVLVQAVEQEVVLSAAQVRPVKELEVLVVRKMPAVLAEFLTDQAAPVLKAIGESVAREVQARCTAVAVAVPDTTAVAVAALTKILAALMPEVAGVDLHTPTQRS
jgi:hypothetical protein